MGNGKILEIYTFQRPAMHLVGNLNRIQPGGRLTTVYHPLFWSLQPSGGLVWGRNLLVLIHHSSKLIRNLCKLQCFVGVSKGQELDIILLGCKMNTCHMGMQTKSCFENVLFLTDSEFPSLTFWLVVVFFLYVAFVFPSLPVTMLPFVCGNRSPLSPPGYCVSIAAAVSGLSYWRKSSLQRMRPLTWGRLPHENLIYLRM